MKFDLLICILVLFIASSLFVGCSDSATPTQNENSDLASTGFSYPIAESPNEVPLLRWDFSGREIHKYSLNFTSEYESQAMYAEPQMGWEEETQTAIIDSDLLIQSLGDGTAKLVMDKTEVTWSMVSGDEQIGPTTETQPSLEIDGLNEDGTTEQGEISQTMLFKYYFPLPPESLEIGESSIIDTQVSMNVEGVSLRVLGTVTTTLLNYMTVDGETCAHLKNTIDISDIQFTEELFESYEYSIEGKTESLFSIAQNRFVAAEGQMQSAFAIMEKSSSEVDLSGNADPSHDNIILSKKTDEGFHIQIVE